MTVRADQCPKGHPTPTAAHRDGKGTCKKCKHDYARNRELKARAALDVCNGLAQYGVRFENGGVPVSPDVVAAQLLRVLADKMT